jgi:hypothetical protein
LGRSTKCDDELPNGDGIHPLIIIKLVKKNGLDYRFENKPIVGKITGGCAVHDSIID